MMFAVEPGWQLIEQGIVRKDRADRDRLVVKFFSCLKIGNRLHSYGSEKEFCQRLLRESESGEADRQVPGRLYQGKNEALYRHIQDGIRLHGLCRSVSYGGKGTHSRPRFQASQGSRILVRAIRQAAEIVLPLAIDLPCSRKSASK
jgi:hypothetical protein